MQKLTLFKGNGTDGVIAYGIIDANSDDGMVTVGELRKTEGETEYSEYRKPLSEIEGELSAGIVEKRATAKSVNHIRTTMKAKVNN